MRSVLRDVHDGATADEVDLRMRQLFPTESEFEKLLRRKLRRRSEWVAETVTSRDIGGLLEAFLTHEVGGPVAVTEVALLSGGASKMQFSFVATGETLGAQDGSLRLVARLEPAEAHNATSRAREFQVLELVAGSVPVPKVRWLDEDAVWFPQPVLIYDMVDGVSKPAETSTGAISGIGTRFDRRHRDVLAPQFVEHLAALHAIKIGADVTGLDAFSLPRVDTTDTALWQLNRARRVWEEDRLETFPLMDLGGDWLAENLPLLDMVSVIHGDYRSGNFLFDPGTLQVTSILDWERSYLGDRHRDLSWTTMPAWTSLDEAGRPLTCGLIEENELLDSYASLTGTTIDPVRLKFYHVLNNYQLVVSALASAQRLAGLGRTHHDVVLASVEGVAYEAAQSMVALLRDVL